MAFRTLWSRLALVQMSFAEALQRLWRNILFCVFVGNSVHADKKFLDKYMPQFMRHLHYRIIDVSTVKELCRWAFPALGGRAEGNPGKPAQRRGLCRPGGCAGGAGTASERGCSRGWSHRDPFTTGCTPAAAAGRVFESHFPCLSGIFFPPLTDAGIRRNTSLRRRRRPLTGEVSAAVCDGAALFTGRTRSFRWIPGTPLPVPTAAGAACSAPCRTFVSSCRKLA